MTHPLNDTMNVWHANKKYHVRYGGKIETFDNYLDAKFHVDSILNSVWFTGFGHEANGNAQHVQ